MAINNISGGAGALQPRGTLFGILSDLDQASVDAYLFASEDRSDPLPASPFNGLLLHLHFDPVEVLSLVDDLWPSRWKGHSGRGRKPIDPLPLVCFLLRLCDTEYGTVFDLSDAYRDLKRDEKYRQLCKYEHRVPSASVFRGVHRVMCDNWARFQGCVAGSERLKELWERFSHGLVAGSDHSDEREDSPALREAFSMLAPNWEFSPAYLEDGRFCEVSRPLGRRRGRAAWHDVANCESESIDSGGGEFPASSKHSNGRDWRAYNWAQTHEATEFRVILGRLADLISVAAAEAQGPRQRGGQPYPLGKVVFATVEKAYSGLSSRRHEGALMLSAQHGFVRNAPVWTPAGFDWEPLSGSQPTSIPHFNTVESFLRSSWLTPLLLELLTLIARPLREIEDVFAVDGTGWSTRWYDRWLDNKEAPDTAKQQWLKLHLAVGVRSNKIARAAVSPGNHHDSPYFKGLVTETANHFNMQMVAGDLGYSSRPNNALGAELGFDVRIPFKSNTLPPADDGSEWSKNLLLFLNENERFMSEYHLRSNVESTNGSVKITHPQKLRCRGFNGQVNEVLAILVAYNIRVLAREVWMRNLELDLESEVLVSKGVISKVVEMRKGYSAVCAA